MTIGPDPITRTDLRSSRRGMATLHKAAELVEMVYRVVRPRGRLRVVLDAEGRVVKQPDALDDAVVQVDVADHGRPVGRGEWPPGRVRPARPGGRAAAGLGAGLPGAVKPGQRGGEAVVVAGDVHPAGGQVHDRLVDAT